VLRAAKQGDHNGLCAIYAIVNALGAIQPRYMTEEMEDPVIAALIDCYPGDVADLIKDGCERPEMDVLLKGAQEWTDKREWAVWGTHTLHPVQGESREEFWDAVAAELVQRHSIALLGFGSDNRGPVSRYEPHWTCVERISPSYLFLRDSSEYARVPKRDTAVRPEYGWAIEDCYILSRGAR
jgi:hypothetical protein